MYLLAPAIKIQKNLFKITYNFFNWVVEYTHKNPLSTWFRVGIWTRIFIDNDPLAS